MFSVKTSNIMQSLKPGGAHAAAADDRANAPFFEQFAEKAKVPPALVKAAFTNSGLNHPDGTFAHDAKDIERLKNYVLKKMDSKALQPQDRERLQKVADAVRAALMARMQSYGTASRRRTPPAKPSSSPKPPAPAKADRARVTGAETRPSAPRRSQTAPARENGTRPAAQPPRRTQTAPAGPAPSRITDQALKSILSEVIKGNAAKTQMEAAPDAASRNRLRRQAQTAYREAAPKLLDYIKNAEHGPNKEAALKHGERVMRQLEELSN